MRKFAYLLILIVFIVLDAVFWTYTYRAATAPPPEELARAAAVAEAAPADSPAVLAGDGFALHVPLTGECSVCAGPWRYLQTGSELAAPFGGGQDYFAPDFDATTWRTMDLPQNWYLAGLNYHGVIWFRQEFTADATWQGRAVNLRFDGVDYLADVWLNGQKLGHHEGYFQPFTFDVSSQLHYGAKNVLAVRVDSPWEEYDTVWPNRKTLVKGILEQHNARPGGAWTLAGQAYNTGGIWNGIALEVSDAVAVAGVQVQATWPTTVTEGMDADVQARVTVRNFADEPVTATVQVTFAPRNFTGAELTLPAQSITLPRGETTVTLSDTVAQPVALVAVGPRPTQPLHGARRRHGERRRRWPRMRHPSASARSSSATTGRGRSTANGSSRAARTTSARSGSAQTDDAWFRRDLQLIRDANLNFIRVQAHVEPAAFYAAADELGLLVWQDFPLQWGYSDAPAFVDQAQSQLRDMIELLYNHPSIVVWCMHNEPPWDTPALASHMDEYDRRQNKRLDELLYDEARKLDPTRFIQLDSGGTDKHIYAGWDAGAWTDYADLPGAPFVSEFGAQALPGVEMMKEMFAPEEYTYASGETRTRWEFHDFQARQTFDVAGIDPGLTTRQFIANSQAYQANLLKYATETYRRAKYDPMQGIVQFMFADAWPAISWSVLDYHRRPKAGYAALQTAMQPVLPSIDAPLPARLDGTRWVYTEGANPAFSACGSSTTISRRFPAPGFAGNWCGPSPIRCLWTTPRPSTSSPTKHASGCS